jgi:hypothetical protein
VITGRIPSIFDAENLFAQARDIAGLDNVDETAVEPMHVLVESVNRESYLHERGVEGMSNKLLRILANRLRMQRDFAAHPEIAEQEITAPIIIEGMPRTGSTKTQKLFAASGDFNWLAMWQTTNPSLLTGSRDESTRSRIDGALAYEAWLEKVSPDMKSCHQFLAMEPEEDSWILEHSLITPVFLGFSPVGSYLKWMVKQDISVQFEFLRDTLKYLQWQGVADPGRRWILKCPMYYGLEPAILNTFPDAHFLMTHRSPVFALPSGARMLELFHLCFSSASPNIDMYYRGAESGLNRHIRNREADPEMKVLDIHYLDLVDGPETVIETVYDFAGVPLTGAALEKMLGWNTSNPKDAKGRHIYSLEQYGFTEAQIEDDFSEYLEFMESRVGRR